MARLKVKTPGQKLQVKASLSFGEKWNSRERDVLETELPKGFMRIEMVSGRTAYYSAPADMTLERYLGGGLDREAFFRMIMQIVNVFRQIDRYHLKYSNLQLDPKWIFVNCHSKDLFFLYQPLDLPGDPVSPHRLLNLIANAAAGYDTEVKAIDELQRLVAMSQVIQNADLEALVVRYMPELQREFLFSDGKKKKKKSGTIVVDDSEEEEQSVSRGTTLIDDDEDDDIGGTVLLDDWDAPPEPVRVGYLRRVRTGESVRITGDVFRLGRSHMSSDFCIEDNLAVGRAHAEIITRNGRFYICDTNSKNGTYVDDGPRLPEMQETELKDGCKIRLANEDFDFQIIQE